MPAPLAKRWLHPQTVPRGFLRLYILTMLSRGPETGGSIMQKLEEKTDRVWRPGPGTIYPLLKGLVSEGLVKSGRSDRSGSKGYVLTPKGKRELDEVRKTMVGAGKKEPVMAKLFSDLLPGDVFLQIVIRRYREGSETFRQKLREVPKEQRPLILKELRLLAEGQIQWIDSELASLK